VADRDPGLRRAFGLWQATALNVTMIVGAGIFVTVPPMLEQLPGPAALWGWLAAGALVLVDGLVWSELGAALPGSGGSYVYLLECYGPHRWGRLMAFLFIWQFLLSGPLELGSGLIAADAFVRELSPSFAEFNRAWTRKLDLWPEQQLSMTFSPVRLLLAGLGVGLLVLLYRRIDVLGRLTVVFGLGILAAGAWLAWEGARGFDPARAFAPAGPGEAPPEGPAVGLGAAMVLALYSYLGYYNICYIGEEVRDPGRVIPRSILLSAALVCVLFVGLHLAMLGTVPWRQALASYQATKEADLPYVLPADLMRRARGAWAAQAVLVLLIGSCLVSAFAGLLGYSRIPYGAARAGHFFPVLGRAHPRHHIPHVSLLLVGGLTLFWGFFDLDVVIKALIATRIPAQFLAQAAGAVLLRHRRPDLARPFRMPLYPLPCLLAAAGWLYVLVAIWLTSGWFSVILSLGTLAAGVVVFLVWSGRHPASRGG
jgi:amino acid transporter